MKTPQRALSYSRKPALRSISPSFEALSSMGAAFGAERRCSGAPSRMNSPVISQATRNVGLKLYEILGIAELTRVAYDKGEFMSVQARLSVLMSETELLASEISNIVELSRLETEPAEAACERFDLVALLNEVSETARKIVGSRPVTVMDVFSPGPVVVYSDPAKIRRIMTGLVSNAAKFTERGRISMILGKDDKEVRLTVADTGRGMTPEQITAVFESSEHGYDIEMNGLETSGLGLRIVKALVKKLNGTLSVASKPGEGTIVEVSLPMEPLS